MSNPPSALTARSGFRLFVLVAGVTAAAPATASAGMPSFSLHELAQARVEVISFFLVGFLLCGLVVKWAWNALAAAFGPRMPRLRYREAVGLVLLSGLLLYVVLTMISGARELMTPGAWQKDGLTYQLTGRAAPEPRRPEPGDTSAGRLKRLHAALVAYAAEHGGQFPVNRDVSGIPAETWSDGADEPQPFGYVGGLRLDSDGGRLLAFELLPRRWGRRLVAVQVDGAVRQLSQAQLQERLKAELAVGEEGG